MNRDRGKWVGPLKGVHVTMYTAWHARAVLLWMAAIKTTCQFHSFVDGHLGYSHVLGWEERKSSRLMAKGETFTREGWSWKVTSSESTSLRLLFPQTWAPRLNKHTRNVEIYFKFYYFRLSNMCFSEVSEVWIQHYIIKKIIVCHPRACFSPREVKLCAKAITSQKGKTIMVERRGERGRVEREGAIQGREVWAMSSAANLIQCHTFLHPLCIWLKEWITYLYPIMQL